MDNLSSKLLNLEKDIIQSKIKYLNMDISYTLRSFYDRQICRYQKFLSITSSNLRINKSLNYLIRHLNNNKETHIYYLNKNISLNIRMLRNQIHRQYTANILYKFSILHKIIYYKKDMVYNRIKNRIIQRDKKERECRKIERECKKIERIFHQMIYKMMCKNIQYMEDGIEDSIGSMEDDMINYSENTIIEDIEKGNFVVENGMIETRDGNIKGNEESRQKGNEESRHKGNEESRHKGNEESRHKGNEESRHKGNIKENIKENEENIKENIKTEDRLVEVHQKNLNIIFRSVEMSTDLNKVSSKTTSINGINFSSNDFSDILNFHISINNSFSRLNNSMIMKLLNFSEDSYTDTVKLRILFTLKNVNSFIKGISFYGRRSNLQNSDKLSFILQKGSLDNDRRFLMMIDDTLSDIEKYKDPVVVRMGIQFILAKKYVEDIIYLKEE
jgi:hypothetical protein